jgi:hypothetical protein
MLAALGERLDMTISRALRIALLAPTAATLLLAGPARSGDKYQSTVVEASPNVTAFSLAAPGSKVLIKPSGHAGDGGVQIKLDLKNVDCSPNNDQGTAGRCGVDGSPITNHVLDISVNVAGTDFKGIAAAEYQIERGRSVFMATGTNRIGGDAFGALSSIIFGQPLGIGQLKMRGPGSECDPSGTFVDVDSDGLCDRCEVVPLVPGNTCLDGPVYAITGVVFGSDPALICTTNTDCGVSAECIGGFCIPEACSGDNDCDQAGGDGTGGGSGQCAGPPQNTCCDPGPGGSNCIDWCGPVSCP